MTASLELVIDAVDAEAVAHFWAQALPAEVLYRRPPYLVLGLESGIRVLIQQVGDPREPEPSGPVLSSAPERIGSVHIDLRVDDPTATVERIVALGARVLRHVDEREDGGTTWTVLEDPWGMAFCIAPARDTAAASAGCDKPTLGRDRRRSNDQDMGGP